MLAGSDSTGRGGTKVESGQNGVENVCVGLL